MTSVPAITKYHRANHLNNEHLFLTVLEVAKSKIEVLAELVSAPCFADGFFLAVSSCGREREIVSSYKATNPIMVAHLHGLI